MPRIALYLLALCLMILQLSCSDDDSRLENERTITVKGQMTIVGSKQEENDAIVQFKSDNEVIAYAFTKARGFYETSFKLSNKITELTVNVIPTSSILVHEMSNASGVKLVDQKLQIDKEEIVLNIKMIAQAYLWIQLNELGNFLDYDQGIAFPLSNFSGASLRFEPDGSINTDKHLFPIPGGIEDEVHVTYFKNQERVKQVIYPVTVTPFDTAKIIIDF